jgi:hypothetical protein
MKAIYQCIRCGMRWESKPGPTQCHICYHLYVKWLNYEDMRKIWDEKEKTENKV